LHKQINICWEKNNPFYPISANNVNMMKKFIRNVVLTLVLLTPLLGLLLVNDAIMAAATMDKKPWVHWNGLDPSREVYISWETASNASSFVEYGLEPNAYIWNLSDSTPVSMHRLKLPNLDPNTRYYYRVSNDLGGSNYATGTFKTAPSTNNFTKFTFAILSDTQNFMGTGHYPRMARVLASMDDLAFVAFAGDMAQDHGQTSLFSPDSRQPSWNDFWRHTNRFSPTIPIVPDPGNHDNANAPLEENIYQRYFGVAISPNHNYYSFNWSRTQFVMVQIADGGDDGRNSDPELPTFQQDLWINATLEAGQALDYRILVFHRALFSSNGNDQNLIDRFMPILVHYNVSLLLYGHEHCYERFYIQNRNIVCLGAGGGLMNGHLKTQEGRQIGSIGPSFTTVTLDATGITITTLTPTMNTIESVHLTKEGTAVIPDVLI
jgi:hypothetical protein